MQQHYHKSSVAEYVLALAWLPASPNLSFPVVLKEFSDFRWW